MHYTSTNCIEISSVFFSLFPQQHIKWVLFLLLSQTSPVRLTAENFNEEFRGVTCKEILPRWICIKVFTTVSLYCVLSFFLKFRWSESPFPLICLFVFFSSTCNFLFLPCSSEAPEVLGANILIWGGMLLFRGTLQNPFPSEALPISQSSISPLSLARWDIFSWSFICFCHNLSVMQ